MKKSMFLAAVAAMVLAGCTKDESIVEQQEIGFQPLAYKASQTKANVITGATYGTEDPEFGLFAYQLADGKTFDADKDEAKLYIDNKRVHYDSGNWRTNPKSFWPLQGSLTFIAYSPYSVKDSVTHAIMDVVDANPSTVKASVLTINGFQAGTEGQKDLMWSTLSKDKTSNGNIGDNIVDTITQEYNGVPILFKHALCRIKIAAKTTADYSGFATYKIKKIEIANLKDNATLTVTDDIAIWSNPTTALGTESGSDKVFDFFAPAEVANYVTLNDSTPSAVNYKSEEAAGNGLLAIPQTLDANVKLLVTYTMTVDPDGSKTGDEVVTEITKPVTLNTNLSALQQNKVYTLNLSISADEILYSPDVNDWTPQSSADY